MNFQVIETRDIFGTEIEEGRTQRREHFIQLLQ